MTFPERRTVAVESRLRRLTSGWLIFVVNLACIASTIAFSKIHGAHRRVMATECGALVTMSGWVTLGLWIVVGVTALGLVAAAVFSGLRVRRGWIGRSGAVITYGFLGVMGFLAVGFALLVILDNPPYRVPCF